MLNLFKNYFFRPFPTHFCEFKNAMVSYSQFGEDLLVQEILGYQRRDIFYIDIGAFHPISKSNTYIFYKRGGKGICVEPNPLAKELWRRFRPRDIFVGNGVTGGLNCFLKYQTECGSGEQNHFNQFVSEESINTLNIQCINIRQLIEDFLPSGQPVDLLSLDCEGMDIDLIRNFPFDLVRPRVVLVEDFEYSEKSDIHMLMANSGYEMKSYAKITKIFVNALQ